MNAIAQRLGRDHDRLEKLLRRLGEACEQDDVQALQRAWSEFESSCVFHMQAEERYLLPLIEAAHPAEAALTRREHDEIRRLMAELGVEVDLHVARASEVERLVQVMRRHADREDQTLYRLAGDVASGEVERRLAGMLKAAVHGVLESLAPAHAGFRR